MIIRPSRVLFVRAFSTSASRWQADTPRDEICKKLLRVALIGAPNAGKSTLLNKLIQADISCVSNKVHTTRQNILGVYTENDTQLEFYDSPGVVAKKHLLKHSLENSLYTEPKEAVSKCDLITVVIDGSNIREQKRLNKGVLQILADHRDKESILVMNKVDLIKDKRRLFDIGTRLTQGCLNGKLTFDCEDINRMEERELRQLNLMAHQSFFTLDKYKSKEEIRKHKYVIELDPPQGKKPNTNPPLINRTPIEIEDPDSISYKEFSNIFSISALTEDGVDELREYMLNIAKPVDKFPHSPDYLTNQRGEHIVMSIIRGKFMDHLPGSLPYQLKFSFNQFEWDEMGSLLVNMDIICPHSHAIGQVIGEKGCIITKVISESRDSISKTLGCDVKLTFNPKVEKSRRMESSSKNK